jgi:hypothetical protein
MNMGDLSTFYSLPQSLSSEVYSFPCRGPVLPFLSLLQPIWQKLEWSRLTGVYRVSVDVGVDQIGR